MKALTDYYVKVKGAIDKFNAYSCRFSVIFCIELEKQMTRRISLLLLNNMCFM